MPFIANGGVDSRDKANDCLAYTGCDAVMSGSLLLQSKSLFSSLFLSVGIRNNPLLFSTETTPDKSLEFVRTLPDIHLIPVADREPSAAHPSVIAEPPSPAPPNFVPSRPPSSLLAAACFEFLALCHLCKAGPGFTRDRLLRFRLQLFELNPTPSHYFLISYCYVLSL